MPSTVPSSVHTEETNRPSTSYRAYGDCLRDSCRKEYEATEAIYSYLDKLNSTSKRFNLENCRTSAWFVRNIDTGAVRVAANSCHLRWCPVCSDSRRSYISHSVAAWVEQQSHPKFLTLTLKHSDASLNFQIDCLYRFFRSLRKRSDFRNAVPGGFWFFQVKKSKNDGRWHPHLHCIISGLYIPHSRLSRMWLEITNTSSVVDIRPIRDPLKACNDAARYAACPGSLAGLPFADALELVECMHGRRICGTWGTARQVSLRPPTCPDKEKWETVGSWSMVMAEKDHHGSAQQIFQSWRDDQPLEAGVKVSHKGPEFSEFDIDNLREYESEFEYPSERSPPCANLSLNTSMQ